MEVLVLAVSHNLCIRLESIPKERRVADGHRRITRRDSIFNDQGKEEITKRQRKFEEDTCFRGNERLVTMKVAGATIAYPQLSYIRY